MLLSGSGEDPGGQGALGDVPTDLLLVTIVDLILPGLEDAIDDFWWCVGLEELGLIECLRQHVAEGVEGRNKLSLPRVGHLEGRRYVAQLVAEGHLA